MTHAKVNDGPTDQRAQQVAQAQTARDGPEHIHRPPAPATFTQFVQAKQAQAQHHQGKSRAIVQPAFTGQAKTQPVTVAQVGHLHVRSQHRIGRRQDGPKQHRRAEGQAQTEHAKRGDGSHRDQHRHGRELHRNAPAPVAQWQFEFHTGGEERDQHGHFGQALQQHGVFQGIEPEQPQTQGADCHTCPQVKHGGAQRQTGNEGAAQRHGNQQQAGSDAAERESGGFDHDQAGVRCCLAAQNRGFNIRTA